MKAFPARFRHRLDAALGRSLESLAVLAGAVPLPAVEWTPPPFLAPSLAVGCLLLFATMTAVTGGPLSEYRALIGLPIVAAVFLPAAGAMAIVGCALLIALGPLAADRLLPSSAILPAGTQAAIGTLLPELLIQVMVFVALRLVVQVRDARRDAAAALRVAAAGSASSKAARARVEAILGLAGRLSETVDRDTLLEILVTELNRTLGTDATSIRILDGDVLRVVAQSGIPAQVAARLPAFRRSDPWFERVVRSRHAWAVHELDPGSAEALSYASYPGTIVFRSVLVAPLIRDDEVVGVLASITVRPREWTEEDVEFATAVATHASIALRNADLFATTQAWATRLGVVQAASARMSRQNTVESVGRAIVEETRSMVDYHNCRVYVFDPPDQLRPIAFEGRVGAYEKVELDALRLTVGRGLTGWVAEHGVPLLVPDATADARSETIAGTDDVDESMVVVPMRYDERLVGVITLSKLGLAQFDEGHLRLMTILADQAATALESARLLGRSQALARELGQLLAMGSELAQSLDPRQVADLIARHLADALGVDECAISYWDRPSDRILTWGYHPSQRRAQVDESYELASFPETRRVMTDQATIEVRVDDPAADRAEVELLLADGHAVSVMLPLVAKGASIGLVELISTEPVRFDAARLELARTMANEAAMALENARLYEDARMLADRDPLTGFLNHRSLHERLGEEIIRAQRSRRPLGLLMLDLDDFKLVNDSFGHQFGDRVLLWAAELIRSTLRASDVSARYGGDEFAVLLPDSDLAACEATAKRVLAAFRDRPYLSEGRGPVPVGVSIGCAAFPADARTPLDLIAVADDVLYRVKKAGGHQAGSSAGDDREAEDGGPVGRDGQVVYSHPRRLMAG